MPKIQSISHILDHLAMLSSYSCTVLIYMHVFVLPALL